MNTRAFEAVQQPVCIVLPARDGSSGAELAPVRHRTLTAAIRQDKFTELATLSLAGDGWRDCSAYCPNNCHRDRLETDSISMLPGQSARTAYSHAMPSLSRSSPDR